jgi:hypothetical protein
MMLVPDIMEDAKMVMFRMVASPVLHVTLMRNDG